MKRTVLGVFVIFVIVLNVLNCGAEEITFDNRVIQLENPIINKDGVSYIPARELFEGLGFNVLWHSDEKRIDIQTKKYPLYENPDVREGTIHTNDLNYKFYGDTNFSYDELEQTKNDITNYQKYSRICTAEQAADIGRVYLRTEIEQWAESANLTESDAIMDVSYSSDLDAWCITFRIGDIMFHHEPTSIVLSASDGRVLKVYQGL